MPQVVTAKITSSDREDIHSAIKREIIPSRLECFKLTNGIRPGEFSVIVGKQGNGKSALCKTIGFEAAIAGINTLFILSEEKTASYKWALSDAFHTATTKNTDKFLERLYFDSMLEWVDTEKKVDFFFEYLENQINELETDLVIFDNFTTSFLGSLPINTQGAVIDKLRLLAAEYDIAIIGVFHTVKGTNIYNKILDGEDVRGNASSTNSGSYNYILTTYFRANPVRAILNIDKARYHGIANKTYWELLYDKDLCLYTSAIQTNYESIEAMIKEVNSRGKDKLKAENKKW